MENIAAQAIADMRTACTLRSEKYGQQGCSNNTVKAYQAALRNLADALEIHHKIANPSSTNISKIVTSLRLRATNLCLTNQQVLAACTSGDELTEHTQQSVARDVRLGDSANYVIQKPNPTIASRENCMQCQIAIATHRGFSCRCLCLCENCVIATGKRISECPVCEDFIEFVRD